MQKSHLLRLLFDSYWKSKAYRLATIAYMSSRTKIDLELLKSAEKTLDETIAGIDSFMSASHAWHQSLKSKL